METYTQIASKVVNGEVDALKTYIELKRADKELKSALATVQGLAIDEAEKYSEKTFDAFGAEVGLKNSAGRWNFKDLDWWDEFQDKQDTAKQSYHLNKKKKQLIDDEGVVVQPAEYTEGKLTIAIKLK